MKEYILQAARQCSVCLDDEAHKDPGTTFFGRSTDKVDVLILGKNPIEHNISTIEAFMVRALVGIPNDVTYRIKCNPAFMKHDAKEVETACDVFTNQLLSHYKVVIVIDPMVDAFTDPEEHPIGPMMIKTDMDLNNEQVERFNALIKGIVEK